MLIRHRQTLVQTFGGNPACFRRQVIDGLEGAPGEHIPAAASQRDDERKTEHEDGEHFPQLAAQPLFGPGHSENDRASPYQSGAGERAPYVAVCDNRLVSRLRARRGQRHRGQYGGRTGTVDLLAARRPDIAASILVVVGIVASIAGPLNPAAARRREKALRRFVVVMQLVIELLDELVTDGHERRRRVYHEHQAQHDAVPRGQAQANRWSGPPRHGSPSLSTNPTPRTV